MQAHDEPTPTNTMVTCLTPAVVLGLTENLQGSSKFFNMLTKIKIKQQKLTAYPMPEFIIKKVEQFGKSNARQNTLNFSNRNWLFFEWNNKVDKYHKELVNKDVVLYPSLAAKIPRVVLEQDLPILTIEDKIKPQGCTEDAAAHNANLKPFDIAGVDAPTMRQQQWDQQD